MVNDEGIIGAKFTSAPAIEQSALDVIKAASAVRQDDEGNWEYLRRCDQCGEWVHLVEHHLKAQDRLTGLAVGKCSSCKAQQLWQVMSVGETNDDDETK